MTYLKCPLVKQQSPTHSLYMTGDKHGTGYTFHFRSNFHFRACPIPGPGLQRHILKRKVK